MTTSAILVLADGSVFHGTSVGHHGTTSGEVVFNTSMTGYQEILTDPSYAKQIVTLTYPHIGNTGTNGEDEESRGVFAAGLIIRDLPLLHSNFRASESLQEYLVRHQTVAIADIDTRRLTRILRDKGAQAGAILTGADATEEKAQALIAEFGSIENLLDEQYTTVWGQRAPLYYSPASGPASLYDYKGRGRTFGVNYSVLF